MLLEHEYPIYQELEEKQGGRSLVFGCAGERFHLLSDAIKYQAFQENRERQELPRKRRKVRR